MSAKLSVDGGFTLVETLVSLLILSILLAALAPLVRTSLVALEGATSRSRELYDIAVFHRRFREFSARTEQPLWLPSKALTLEDPAKKRWTIGGLDGEAGRGWFVEGDGEGLRLGEGEWSVALRAKGVEVREYTQGGRVVGLAIVFTALGREWHWRENFASAGY